MIAFINKWLHKSENKKIHTDNIGDMLRLFCECEEDPLKEVLMYLSDIKKEECILSIVNASTREIVASTIKDMSLTQTIVYSISRLDKKATYKKGQRTNVIFRKGISEVLVLPLMACGSVKNCLLMELSEEEKALPRIYFDALSLMAETYQLKKTMNRFALYDPVSNLPNRSVFFEDAKNKKISLSVKIVVISLCEETLINRGLLKEKGTYQMRLKNLLKKHVESVYFLGGSGFSFFSYGKEFDVVADVNAIMDKLLEEDIPAKCGISALLEDEYLSLYLAERASMSATCAQVIFIKDKDSIFTREDIYASFRDHENISIGEAIQTVSFKPFSKEDESGDTYYGEEPDEGEGDF